MAVNCSETTIKRNIFGTRINGFIPYNSIFYNTSARGGINAASSAYAVPLRSKANVLCNCVGLASGAFNEAYWDAKRAQDPSIKASDIKCKFPFNRDGCKFIEQAKTFSELQDCIVPVWETPPLGGIIVWGDGLNHVAYIAEVHSKDKITIVQAGYNTSVWTQTNNAGTGYVCDVREITRNDGGLDKWAYSSGAKSRSGGCIGYIRNPAIGTIQGPQLPIQLGAFVVPQIDPSGVRIQGEIATPYVYVNGKWQKTDMMLYDGASWLRCL